MMAVRRLRGVTLVEVVVAAAALGGIVVTVGSVALKPKQVSASRACLGNLQRIGQATQMYADEDPREQIVPIHMNMVRARPTWMHRAVNSFAWGGRGGVEPFWIGPNVGWLLDDTAPTADAEPIPEYAAVRRPLNLYLAADGLDVFHCPADVGYPDNPYEGSLPSYSFGYPCWNILGNSYRANTRGLMLTGSAASVVGAFSLGPWGHARSTLPNASRLVLIADPLFYSQLQTQPGPPPDVVNWGWHNAWRKENVLYCDGSARATSTEGAILGPGRRPLPGDGLGLDLPPIDANFQSSLCSGPTWQTDCYPAPGAVLFGNWAPGWTTWPWFGAYTNP